jgi:hypothetical protein
MVRTFLKVYGTWLLIFGSATTNKRHHHHQSKKSAKNAHKNAKNAHIFVSLLNVMLFLQEQTKVIIISKNALKKNKHKKLSKTIYRF